MKRIIALASCVLSACAQVEERRDPGSPQEITSAEAKNFLRTKEAAVIDVRSHDERLVGEVPSAVEILFGPIHWTERPVSPEDVATFLRSMREKYPNQNTRLVIFCNIGVRSQAAGRVLAEDGYTAVMTVRDGFLGNRYGEGLQGQLF